MSFSNKISVITATYNAKNYLPYLIESLRNQSDKDFEWVVADGSSTDGTLELLHSITDLNIKIVSQHDFGIYDALNRGINVSSGEFYLVMGADDTLYPNAIEDYKNAINSEVDIVTAAIQVGDRVNKAGRGPAWFCGQFHYVSGHAVGAIFRKSLHKRFGFYSRKFPIASDQLFILKACNGGAKLRELNSIVGSFNLVGVSSVDILGTITEFYRVQMASGYNKYIQTILFFLRLAKNIGKI